MVRSKINSQRTMHGGALHHPRKVADVANQSNRGRDDSIFHMIKPATHASLPVAAPAYAIYKGSSKKRSQSLVLQRDSTKQLKSNHRDGRIYETAKSRRTRTRAALEQSGSLDSAIALGGRERKKQATIGSHEVQDLETQLEMSSFSRAARIRDGLKRKQDAILAHLPTKRKTKKKKKALVPFHLQPGRSRPNGNAGVWRPPSKDRSPSQVSEDDATTRNNNIGNSSITNRNDNDALQAANAANTAIKTRNIPASVVNLLDSDSDDSDSEGFVDFTKKRNLDAPPALRNESAYASDSDGSEVATGRRQSDGEENANTGSTDATTEYTATGRESASTAEVSIKREIIDLSNDDDDLDVKVEPGTPTPKALTSRVALQTMTQLLFDEAIGRGANRNEMKAYAEQLLKLGLHSKEMILDGLSNSLDLVNNWNWMKDFHKIVFRRWVLSEQTSNQEPLPKRKGQPRGCNYSESKISLRPK